MENTKVNTMNLINWVEVSRLLANNDTSVSRNRCPKKYQPKVDKLINVMEMWIENNKGVSEDIVENTSE